MQTWYWYRCFSAGSSFVSMFIILIFYFYCVIQSYQTCENSKHVILIQFCLIISILLAISNYFKLAIEDFSFSDSFKNEFFDIKSKFSSKNVFIKQNWANFIPTCTFEFDFQLTPYESSLWTAYDVYSLYYCLFIRPVFIHSRPFYWPQTIAKDTNDRIFQFLKIPHQGFMDHISP